MPDKPETYHVTDILVQYRLLGQHKADGRALQQNKIIQVDKRLNGPALLDTFIHECLHVLCPYLHEDTVAETASQIAAVVDQHMEVVKRKKPKT